MELDRTQNKVDNRFIVDFGKIENRKLCDGTVKLVNNAGINHDHRGSDHCLVKIPFYDAIILENPTTHDFIRALYQIKSHHWENWYELFCTSNINVENDIYTLEIQFDHGS
tara:strand:+ start:1235 stop:1567 length:333 start_codon:yes stop_codon:yes gene_type:complete